MQRFDVWVFPTEEEWLDGLKRSGLRRAGKLRLSVQTAVLAAVAVLSAISFFADRMQEPMSAVIAVAASAVIPVMWGVPVLKMRSMAKAAAEEGTGLHFWMFDNGFDFGEKVTEAYYAFGDVAWTLPTEDGRETAVLRTKSDEVVVLPKRFFTDEQWNELEAAIRQA